MGVAPDGTVALLFTDIEGSTALARSAGGDWGELLREHHAIVGGAIERHGGYVDGIEGDAFFATFADPAAAVRFGNAAGTLRERGRAVEEGRRVAAACALAARAGAVAAGADER